MNLISDSERNNLKLALNLGLLAKQSSKNVKMMQCLELANAAARTLAPVMIIGEHGTGKNLIAMSIHHASSKASKPCIMLKCASLQENSVRNRLLGSGPDGKNSGLIAKAADGTLIIDAVDFLSGVTQQELLSILNMGSRNGAPEEHYPLRQFGVRLIATIGDELPRKADGLFVEDLIYRLGEIIIRIPPLRDRHEDIEDLTKLAVSNANHAHNKNVKGLSRTASDFIRHYEFPGNVRELFLMLDRAVRDTSRDIIYLEDLGVNMPDEGSDAHTHRDMTLLPLDEMEMRHINKALLRTGWKTRAAARILQISETMLNRKIKLYGLERESRFE